jgi:hypothetical protein
VITPSAKADGVLGDACLSPTTLPPTGPIQASQPESWGPHPGRVATEPRGSSLKRASVDPLAPTGLATTVRLTETVDVCTLSGSHARFQRRLLLSTRSAPLKRAAIPPSLESDGPLAGGLMADLCVSAIRAACQIAPSYT